MKKRPKAEPFVIDGRGNFLFVNYKGKPKVAIDYSTLFVRMVKKYNKHHKDNSLPHITPHTLRHTFCARLASKIHEPERVTVYHGTFNYQYHNDILDMSKIENGELTLKEKAYSQCEFVKSINTVIKPFMDEREIQFIFYINHSVDVIMVDTLRFNQIFFNLLSNAAKFTPKGGKVEFICEEMEPKDGKEGIRSYVRDNGIGI